jgi:hypothetical protein
LGSRVRIHLSERAGQFAQVHAPWALARRLRQRFPRDTDPFTLRPYALAFARELNALYVQAVRAMAGRLSIPVPPCDGHFDAEAIFQELCLCWAVPNTADGPDTFARAAAHADRHPVAPPASFGPAYDRLYALAYFLTIIDRPAKAPGRKPRGRRRAIVLPQKRVAEWLGVEQQHASRLTRLLVARGLLRVHRGAKAHVRAAEYLFLGRASPVDVPAADGDGPEDDSELAW